MHCCLGQDIIVIYQAVFQREWLYLDYFKIAAGAEDIICKRHFIAVRVAISRSRRALPPVVTVVFPERGSVI